MGPNLTRSRYQPAVALRIQPCLRRDCLAGTDAAGAGCLTDEIALLADLGMSPADALTAGSSAAPGLPGTTRVRSRSARDLVTYHDDPRNDPAILKQPAAIIRRGTRIR